MSDNNILCIANIINNLKTKNTGGTGIADGQKVLIAAVETGCVSKTIANSLSVNYDLSLHWDIPSKS